jgi:hypothetical protein
MGDQALRKASGLVPSGRGASLEERAGSTGVLKMEIGLSGQFTDLERNGWRRRSLEDPRLDGSFTGRRAPRGRPA